MESEPEPRTGGQQVVDATFTSTRLGDGQCAQMDVTVAAPDAPTATHTLDRVQVALVGPGGPLEGRGGALVTGEGTGDTLPQAIACPQLGRHGGPVEGIGPYADPERALAVFLATRPNLAQWGYEELHLADGSRGYVHTADNGVIATVRVARVDGGWSPVSWQSPSC